MINELFGQAIVHFFIGTLMGTFYAWNKKLMFWLIIVLTIFTVISMFYVVPSNVFTAGENPWWLLLYTIFFVVIGMKVGEIIYEGTFKR